MFRSGLDQRPFCLVAHVTVLFPNFVKLILTGHLLLKILVYASFSTQLVLARIGNLLVTANSKVWSWLLMHLLGLDLLLSVQLVLLVCVNGAFEPWNAFILLLLLVPLGIACYQSLVLFPIIGCLKESSFWVVSK